MAPSKLVIGRRSFLLAAPGLLGAGAVKWDDVLEQDAAFYRSAEAARLARVVLGYQNEDGGWPKNLDLSQPGGPRGPSTIDNGATVTPLRLLARVARGREDKALVSGFVRGVEGLLRVQYANGGWPQFFAPRGYQAHITYNDGAIVGVLRLLREVGARQDLPFVDPTLAARAREAVARGITCILRTQIVEAGVKTSWCAQHDRETLRPAKARAYEHPSKSGGESAGIVQLLMEIERPDAATTQAVDAAVAWFRKVRIAGFRVVTKADGDRVLLEDASAPPLWARFYELGTDRPIFSGRDGVIRYALAEIERERRAGYSWYVTSPEKVLRQYEPWSALRKARPGSGSR